MDSVVSSEFSFFFSDVFENHSNGLQEIDIFSLRCFYGTSPIVHGKKCVKLLSNFSARIQIFC